MMLVTEAQLNAHLNRITTPLDPDVAISRITVASGMIAEFCTRVSFELLEDDEITLPGTWDARLELPGAPVVSVSAVTIDGVATADWDLVGNALVRNGQILDVPRYHHGWGGPGVEVGVTYTHGFAVVPDGVQAYCLMIAGQIHANPTLARQLSIDGYTASWGGLDLSGLRRYRHRARTAKLS